jgi:hypothetical protein
VLAEVFDQQQRLGRAAAVAGILSVTLSRSRGRSLLTLNHLFSLTSIADRNPSLIRLKHIDVTKIISPGSAAT